jgi:hypothetical protein
MPPANGNNRKTKPPPPSMRRTFYSPIAMDEITLNYWMEESGKACPIRLKHYPPIDLVPGCFFGFILHFLCFLPVMIIGNKRKNESLRAQGRKWIPNKEKLGLLAFNGRIEMSTLTAMFKLYSSLESSLGLRAKERRKFKEKHAIMALMGKGIDSPGMTKLYFFLEPIDEENCTVYCRAYKRFLDPDDVKANAAVDKPTRNAIASVLTALNVQDVQLELNSRTASGASDTVPLSLAELAEADLSAKPVIVLSLGNLKKLNLHAAIVYYSIWAVILTLIILLIIAIQNSLKNY